MHLRAVPCGSWSGALFSKDEAPLNHNHSSGNSRLLAGSVWTGWRIDVPGNFAQGCQIRGIVGGLREIDVVERVVCLRADLESQRLLLVNVLEECHIDVGKVRPPERIAGIV